MHLHPDTEKKKKGYYSRGGEVNLEQKKTTFVKRIRNPENSLIRVSPVNESRRLSGFPKRSLE